MSAHRARHGASGGGRSVSEILAQVATGSSGAATIAPPQSAFTIAAAAAAGAGAAAATMTGTFPAIQAPTLAGFGSAQVAHIIEPAATSTPISSPVAARPTSSSSFAGTRSTGAKGGTVMASDLHQSDANQIAALSRAVDLNRSTAPEAVTTAGRGHGTSGPVETVTNAVGSLVNAALTLPSKIGGVPIVGTAGSKSAAIALKNAATKLGKPYVWGAKGPNAFDCSGLMQWAYKQAGIKIPPNSSAQARYGTPVSTKNLKPGDMVFYYSPVTHVGMYLGNGKMLHASEPGKPVKISPVDAFPIHNARRVTA